MRFLTGALTLSLFAPLSTLSAQQQPTIEPGARVRVIGPGCGINGHTTSVQAVRGETLVLDTTECPLGSVTRVDVHQGRHGHPWRGAGIGLLVGAVVGAVVGYADANANGCGDWHTSSCVGLTAGVLAVPGALLGAVAGAFIKTDRWEEVPLDRLSVSFTPQRDGRSALGLSVAF